MPDPPIPSLDLTGLQRAPFSEIRGDIEALLADPRQERVDALDGLLIGRALWLLKEGTRALALDEALQLARLLDSEVGRVLNRLDPVVHGAWHGYCELLSEGARRSDPVFVDTLLRSTSGRGERVLEILAAAEGPVPRAALRKQVGISDSNLSHLLRNLEEGELILRTRAGRKVEVELGRIGQEVVERQVRPRWVEHTVALLNLAAGGSPAGLSRQALREELEERGAPSGLVADQLAAAICRLAPMESASNPDADAIIDAVEEEDEDKLAACEPGRRPVELWNAAA